MNRLVSIFVLALTASVVYAQTPPIMVTGTGIDGFNAAQAAGLNPVITEYCLEQPPDGPQNWLCSRPYLVSSSCSGSVIPSPTIITLPTGVLESPLCSGSHREDGADVNKKGIIWVRTNGFGSKRDPDNEYECYRVGECLPRTFYEDANENPVYLCVAIANLRPTSSRVAGKLLAGCQLEWEHPPTPTGGGGSGPPSGGSDSGPPSGGGSSYGEDPDYYGEDTEGGEEEEFGGEEEEFGGDDTGDFDQSGDYGYDESEEEGQ